MNARRDLPPTRRGSSGLHGVRRSRRARRRLTVVLAVAEFLMLAAILSTPVAGNSTEPYVVAAGVATIVIWLLLRGLTRDISERYRGLDEWERTLRNRCARIGFQVGSTALLLLTLYMIVMLGPGHPDRQTLDGVVELTASLAVLVLTTPALLLGWTLPADDDLQDPAEMASTRNVS